MIVIIVIHVCLYRNNKGMANLDLSRNNALLLSATQHSKLLLPDFYQATLSLRRCCCRLYFVVFPIFLYI